MDILKIIFEHNITLEHLSGHNDPRRKKDQKPSLESFLHPQKTYNRYYFTGTRFPDQHFGFTALGNYSGLLTKMDHLLHDLLSETYAAQLQHVNKTTVWRHCDGSHYPNLSEALSKPESSDVWVGGPDPDPYILKKLARNDQTGIRERFEPLTQLLDQDYIVLFAEKAHHGIDFHLFCRNNLYEPIFRTYRDMTGPDLRYFSINGKRVKSERHFYFETWTLHNPPHGFQEVTSSARLR